MSPRRSSRSKTSQLTPSATQQTTSSSSSSVSSGRADRASRSSNKLVSPRSSTVPRSQSSEDREASGKPQVRRTRSSQDDIKNGIINIQNGLDDDEEEEEITRCICGNLEYPGMPSATNEHNGSNARSNGEVTEAVSSATVQEDSGGLFIQCDICKVWQHGGCVGIMDEAMSPDEYFCERCRKDLHKITATARGQKHSIYLPVQENHSFGSTLTPVPPEMLLTKANENRSSRLNPESIIGKRRSTMNSRDAAYDEAEQLRRAIEESKKDGGTAGSSIGQRRGKRSRDGSEQDNDSAKRPRTDSANSSASNSKIDLQNDTENEVEEGKASHSGSKNVRGAAARNHRNKEIREREEKKERERQDAASRRKGRAERRRADDSDPLEEPLSHIHTTSSKAADPGLHHLTSHSGTGTPPALHEQPLPKTSHKKTGRPPARRGRIGRNQYTKDRDSRLDSGKNHLGANSPVTSSNSREGDNSPGINGHKNPYSWSSELGKPSRPRHMNPNRTSMNDMKRRVAGILDFISHTQVEMATEAPLPSAFTKFSTVDATTNNRPITPLDEKAHSKINGTGKDPPPEDTINERENDKSTEDDDPAQFGKLGSLEMMEILTRKLIKWQEIYGD